MSATNGRNSLLEKRERRRHSTLGKQAGLAATNLNQDQIQELRDMFNFLDEDRDGIISDGDLRSVLVSLGQKPSAREITEMLEEVKGIVDFARFVSLFATMMRGTGDSDESVRSAFTCLDEDHDGVISLEDVRVLLTSMGSRLTDQQVDEVFVQGLGTEKEGRFNCEEVVRLLKYGESGSKTTGVST